MARIDALPSLEIIRGLKGILDFYVWRGLPCVRAWPKYRPAKQTAASLAAALLFGAIVKSYSLLGDGPLQAYRADAKDQPRTARDIMVTGVFGNLHQRTIIPPPPPEEEMYNAYVYLRDKKAQGTHGGTFNADAWRTRAINEEQADPKNICTLAANRITLAAGTYRCLISCPAILVNRHQTRLYNVTDVATVLVGTSAHARVVPPDESSPQTRSFVVGRFTIAADKLLEVQHRCQTSRADWGFGVSSNWTDEIYTTIEFWREIP